MSTITFELKETPFRLTLKSFTMEKIAVKLIVATSLLVLCISVYKLVTDLV